MIAATAARAPAQWNALSGAGNATTDAFLVLAQKPGDQGTHVHAFSAMAPLSATGQSWLDLGPPDPNPVVGMPAVRSGDWLALIRRSSTSYRAYSARLHAYADIAVTADPSETTVCAEDDIAVVIEHPRLSTVTVHAYSAHTNQWQSIGSSGQDGFACSRFVAGVTYSGTVYGFSARHGEWVTHSCASGSTLRADGNVLIVDPGAPPTPVLAFSGVTGEWSESPRQSDVRAVELDHNVAYIHAEREDSPPRPQACAYSAYTGDWERGPVKVSSVRHLTDNTVLLPDPANPNLARDFVAFGTRPSVWATLTVPQGETSTIHSGADWIAIDVSTQGTLYAFSGLSGGAWSARAYAGAAAIVGRPDVFVAQDGAGTVHAYSPIHAAFAAAAPPIGTGLRVGRCIAFVENGAQRYAYSTRGNVWVAGPPKNPAAAYSIAATGSLVAMRETGAGLLAMFHERRGAWLTGVVAGAGVPTYFGGRNVLIADATALAPANALLGFSAQRGDWIPAPGFVGNPVGAPLVDENVAAVLDAAGNLHAFGSPTGMHSWPQYPLDSEFPATHDSTHTPVAMKGMIRGNPGDVAYQAVGLLPAFGGIAIPPCGALLLDPAFLLTVAPVGTIGSNGLLPTHTDPLPLQTPAPVAVQVWSQGLLLAGATCTLLGPVPEPASVF